MDCIDTTFCCSQNKCEHPNRCLQGEKLYSDYCDNNFECMSRCCESNKCRNFYQCYNSCHTNLDCETTSSCCSEGFCTDESICLGGNKVKGDYCDKHSECLSKLYCLNNRCHESAYPFLPKDLILIIVIIVICIIFTSVVIYFCFKLCS